MILPLVALAAGIALGHTLSHKKSKKIEDIRAEDVPPIKPLRPEEYEWRRLP